MPLSHVHVFFRKMSTQAFCPLLIWLFFYVESHEPFIYILDINPLSIISFANIFSHSGKVGCLFVLLMVSLAVQTSKFNKAPFEIIYVSILWENKDKEPMIIPSS